MEARDPKFRNSIKTAQFAEPNFGSQRAGRTAGRLHPRSNRCPRCPSAAGSGAPEPLVDPQQGPPLGTRRLRAFPRSDTPLQLQTYQDPTTGRMDRDQQFGNQPGGRRDGGSRFGRRLLRSAGDVDPSAGDEPLMGGSGMVQGDETPLELYLEGNIVFRQGDRVLFAQRMYYDVRRQVGVVLDAEMSSRCPDLRWCDQVAGPDSGTAQPEPVPGDGSFAHVQSARRAELRSAYRLDAVRRRAACR